MSGEKARRYLHVQKGVLRSDSLVYHDRRMRVIIWRGTMGVKDAESFSRVDIGTKIMKV
jgi:hypothetical protein